MEALADEIGRPDLVVALDSTAGNYEQLWVTTSLRGMITGELGVRVLHEGAHSGAAGGIVPSSFRLLRQLMSRIEDEHTGEILPDFLQAQMPAMRDAEAARAGDAATPSTLLLLPSRHKKSVSRAPWVVSQLKSLALLLALSHAQGGSV